MCFIQNKHKIIDGYKKVEKVDLNDQKSTKRFVVWTDIHINYDCCKRKIQSKIKTFTLNEFTQNYKQWYITYKLANSCADCDYFKANSH